MRNIYILLTRSSTLLSRMIGMTTQDTYTHVSLCPHEDLSCFYSFGRRVPTRPLPAGLVREELACGFFALHPDIPCALYRIPVQEGAYRDLCRRLEGMLARAERYRYDLLGLIFCLFSIPHRREEHFFCSQFVGTLLEESGCLSLPRHASLLHPVDFARLSSAELCYTGRIRGLGAWAAAVAA